MNFSALLSVSLALFLMIAVGFLLRKLHVIDEAFTKSLSVFVAKGAQPALIVYSMIKLDYSALNLKNGLIVLGFGVLTHLFMALIAKLAFAWSRDPDEKTIEEFACIFSNCAFVGYPILAVLFGEIGLFYGAFYVIIMNIGLWSYGVFLMARGKGKKIEWRKVFCNVGLVSCAVGLILYISRIPLPDFVLTAFGYLSNVCTPLSLVVTGSLIATMPLKALFSQPKLYYFAAVKLVAMPALAALILRFCGIADLVDGINLSVFLVLMICLPSAMFTTLFSEMHEVRPAYSAHLVCLVMLFSTFTIPLVMKLTEWIL